MQSKHDWTDQATMSDMHIQREAPMAIVECCRARSLRCVVGDLIAGVIPALELKADHVVVCEAESMNGTSSLRSETEDRGHDQIYRMGRRKAAIGKPARHQVCCAPKFARKRKAAEQVCSAACCATAVLFSG